VYQHNAGLSSILNSDCSCQFIHNTTWSVQKQDSVTNQIPSSIPSAQHQENNDMVLPPLVATNTTKYDNYVILNYPHTIITIC